MSNRYRSCFAAPSGFTRTASGPAIVRDPRGGVQRDEAARSQAISATKLNRSANRNA